MVSRAPYGIMQRYTHFRTFTPCSVVSGAHTVRLIGLSFFAGPLLWRVRRVRTRAPLLSLSLLFLFVRCRRPCVPYVWMSQCSMAMPRTHTQHTHALPCTSPKSAISGRRPPVSCRVVSRGWIPSLPIVSCLYFCFRIGPWEQQSMHCFKHKHTHTQIHRFYACAGTLPKVLFGAFKRLLVSEVRALCSRRAEPEFPKTVTRVVAICDPPALSLADSWRKSCDSAAWRRENRPFTLASSVQQQQIATVTTPKRGLLKHIHSHNRRRTHICKEDLPIFHTVASERGSPFQPHHIIRAFSFQAF